MPIVLSKLAEIIEIHNKTHDSAATFTRVVGKLRGKKIRESEMATKGRFGDSPFHTVVDIDEDKKTENLNIDQLPVILCVGINYGQLSSNVDGYTVKASTGMRSKLKKVLRAVGSQIKGQSFHLVAANFFPLLSSDEWRAMAPNRICDVAFFAQKGFSNCLETVASLFTTIGKESVVAAVFHGAHNSVPMLGYLLKDRLGSDFSNIEWIFSDNISSWQNDLSNAIRIIDGKNDRPD